MCKHRRQDTDEEILSPDTVRTEAFIVDAELDSGLERATKAHVHKGGHKNQDNNSTHCILFN